MQSLKIDASGDLVITGGELQMVTGPEEIAQCCKLVLGTNQGEWFLDPELGIDFSRITGKGVTADEVRSEMTAGILQEPRVSEVNDVVVTFDRPNRTVTADITATAVNGDVVTIEGVETVVG
ncbi:hypothetical protein GCM10010912_22830 [Paenibacillus albidus]|uniref:DUF2634 domain-containing protein n=1 Tax=Paenibacillus albidus TaxID=2041023 RepID=A0A917CAV3_9BACL|nr:DUF2634 domain-containing protein [Paenibacillus albidus]GGF77188.1 hypothetical protein GCM10010912_22830 [Paenibacillus albidus]